MTIPIPATTVTVVSLDPINNECCVCGAEDAPGNLGVPVYEGDVLPNDWDGEWFGAPACRRCFDIQSALAHPLSIRAFQRPTS